MTQHRQSHTASPSPSNRSPHSAPADSTQPSEQVKDVAYKLRASEKKIFENTRVSGQPAECSGSCALVKNGVHNLTMFYIWAQDLTRNYRSHQGVMRCANAVLQRLFWFYPLNDVLKPDFGIVLGPKPSLLQATCSSCYTRHTCDSCHSCNTCRLRHLPQLRHLLHRQTLTHCSLPSTEHVCNKSECLCKKSEREKSERGCKKRA